MKYLKYIVKKQRVLFLLMAMILPVIAFSASLIPCEGALIISETATSRVLKADCDFAAFITLIKKVIEFMMFKLAMPLAAISFAAAGIIMMTAGGNIEKIKKAKEIFWFVLVGIFIALSAWLIVNAITSVLLNPGISKLG